MIRSNNTHGKLFQNLQFLILNNQLILNISSSSLFLKLKNSYKNFIIKNKTMKFLKNINNLKENIYGAS